MVDGRNWVGSYGETWLGVSSWVKNKTFFFESYGPLQLQWENGKNGFPLWNSYKSRMVSIDTFMKQNGPYLKKKICLSLGQIQYLKHNFKLSDSPKSDQNLGKT